MIRGKNKGSIYPTFILSVVFILKMMGRRKLSENSVKCKISVTISHEINNKLELLKVNKSKLINSLLQEYLNKF